MKPVPGRTLDLGLRLLDRQIVDADGLLVAKVDDVEFGERDGDLRVTALLIGLGALGPRMPRPIRPLMLWMHRRWRHVERPTPLRIPYDLVRRVDDAVELSVPKSALAVTPLEDWADGVVRRIPGAR